MQRCDELTTQNCNVDLLRKKVDFDMADSLFPVCACARDPLMEASAYYRDGWVEVEVEVWCGKFQGED